MKLAGIILAAGASSRMGSPKPLLTLQGETFLDRLTGRLSAVCSPVIAVLGANAEIIRAGVSREAVFVINPQHELGQLSSLQCGLRALPAGIDGVMFTPVDCPNVSAATLETIAAAFSPGCKLVIPRFEGRRGHPVCCSSDLIAELLALPPDSQARVIVHRHLDEAVYADVDDPGVLSDIDDPEAYRDLLKTAGAQ